MSKYVRLVLHSSSDRGFCNAAGGVVCEGDDFTVGSYGKRERDEAAVQLQGFHLFVLLRVLLLLLLTYVYASVT